MSARRFWLSMIFWLLAPVALLRRLRPRRAGWIEAGAIKAEREP